LVDFGSKWRRKQQLFSMNSRRVVKRRSVSVSIKNVSSSEPKQKLKDDVLIEEEGARVLLLHFTLSSTSVFGAIWMLYYCCCCCYSDSDEFYFYFFYYLLDCIGTRRLVCSD
jgi:hypothetical protein